MTHRRIRSAAWLLASLSRAHAAVHDVKVGEDGLGFSPDTLEAREGDVINYSFHSGVSPQHPSAVHILTAAQSQSVIQTSLESPCEPVEDGFSSGSVSAEAAEALTFRVILNQTDPVYVYSGEGDSCSKGMLQVINP